MAQYFSPRVVTNGLIALLDAANPKSYPGTGAVWNDLSGNNNHGTIASGDFINNGDGSSYLRNVGGTSGFFYVSLSNSTSINSAFSVTTGGWTIEELIWTNSVTYPEADGGSVASSPAYTAGATGFDWNHGVQSTTQIQFGQSSNAVSSYEDQVTINIPSSLGSLNAWRLRTMIWDRSNNRIMLYINGTYVGAGNTPGTAGTSIYDGGGIVFGSLYGWKHFGRRGSIKIYNRALTSDEILQNYVALSSRYRF